MLQISHAAGRAAVAKRGVFLKKKKHVCSRRPASRRWVRRKPASKPLWSERRGRVFFFLDGAFQLYVELHGRMFAANITAGGLASKAAYSCSGRE